MGSEVTASTKLTETIDQPVVINSAEIGELWSDDAGVISHIDYPKHSTVKDRQRITGHVLNGYARTNVRTTADMSACSLVTHRDYLVAASRNLDRESFALTWLAAFAGIDYQRPLLRKSGPKDLPPNDEILIDPENKVLEYKILRRKQKDDSALYETCGLMRLPIPEYVATGLVEIANIASQESSIDVCNKHARKYSNSNAGLTPTLRRLRSGARIHFAPDWLTELEFAAVSGRVPPPLKAISYYYPHSRSEIARRFLESYERTAKRWRLPGKLQQATPARVIQRYDTIFCKQPLPLSNVRNVLAAIESKYTDALSKLKSRGNHVTLQSVFDTVNIHQLSCYVLQEIGVGLRPTGEVARFVAVSACLGSMTADKGSRLFSERSYSPISIHHWKLLESARANQAFLRRQLRNYGIAFDHEETGSDLACEFAPTDKGCSVSRSRLTGMKFHASMTSLGFVMGDDMTGNWIRHVAADQIGASIPQWQANEFLSHRRVGREPFGKWSTAGAEHFVELSARLAAVHKDLIPPGLHLTIGKDDPSGLPGQHPEKTVVPSSEQVRKPRYVRQDSLLPHKVRNYGRLSYLQAWYSSLWGDLAVAEAECSFHLLRTYASIVIDSAIPHRAAIDSLVGLLKCDQKAPAFVAIPAQRHQYSKRKTILGFNKTTRLAIYCWLDSEARLGCPAKSVRPKRLIQSIEARLKRGFEESLRAFDASNGLTFRDIGSLGLILALHSGADPYLISAISGNIRPVSQSIEDPYPLVGVSSEAFAHLLSSHGRLSLRSEELRSQASGPQGDKEIPPEWVADAKKLLRDMCTELQSAISKHVNTPKKRAVASEIFDKFEHRTATMGPKDSAVLLAIRYARKRFIEDASINAGTLRQYLDRAVISGLLDNENAFSLEDWDTDDFIENLEDRISSTRLMPRSKKAIIDAYRPFLAFLATELSIPPVNFSNIAIEYVGGAGQWRLISPHAIDKLIFMLADSGSRNLRHCAIVIAIAYYGGLRATEIRRLTLADVVFDKKSRYVDIECLRGKSRNSRRRLPFHQLAPKRVLNLIRNYWSERMGEFPERNRLSSIALLGLKSIADGYRYDSLVRLTRQILKQAFGESANIHLLRHCFCSSLFVRWYSIRHPSILADLRDRSHSLYQPYLQKQLATYFDCMPFEDGSIRPYDLISMIKLTGHASPETLFQYYIHSYSVIQNHAVNRMNVAGLNQRLTDPVIAAWIPGMKSSRSRAKFQSRTIGGISSFVFGGTRTSRPGVARHGS